MLSTTTDRPVKAPLKLPPIYDGMTLDTYQPATPSAEKALAAAFRMAVGDDRNLVLIGAPGVGKSHLAAAVCRSVDDTMEATWWDWKATADAWLAEHPDAQLVRRALPPEIAEAEPSKARPIWENVPRLIIGMRSEIGTDEHRWDERREELAGYRGLVVLDDVGREKISDWTGEAIYTLINDRYEFLRRTILTSNLTGAELNASGYWPAISRLAEGGALVRIEASDWRLKKVSTRVEFRLTMPGNGAWDGRWTGAGRNYVVIRTLDDKAAIALMAGQSSRSWYHHWDDGWTAEVTARLMEPGARLPKSDGFYGYDWMVTNILAHGDTRAPTEAATA